MGAVRFHDSIRIQCVPSQTIINGQCLNLLRFSLQTWSAPEANEVLLHTFIRHFNDSAPFREFLGRPSTKPYLGGSTLFPSGFVVHYSSARGFTEWHLRRDFEYAPLSSGYSSHFPRILRNWTWHDQDGRNEAQRGWSLYKERPDEDHASVGAQSFTGNRLSILHAKVYY